MLLARTISDKTTPTAFGHANNWKDMLKVISIEDSLSIYNVVVANPVFESYAHTTRLRFFDDSGKKVKVMISVEASIKYKQVICY